ncbi:PEP-CTERM sorting domain-containing protein [Coraliomargarita sp. SDUM461004]|uniref:PEP-CTERM sorting domain-containing protein n=1 Tax=Thalassobacterium sedimentorum TaxID=3041258 RepID=A0ABU1AGV0_9BACT|nr:PEP-CTERM sorting domain-containing protein [Coraliomargarita sp. SDUM461004]MDQ8194049.1 PEP-CTERM sorting domain-containing protein [Coraliomargarita sp. SDUM461004]
MKKLLLLSLGSICAASMLQAQFTITDSVENNDGWEILTGGGFSTGVSGLAPTDGSTFFYARTGGSGNRGAAKYFSETFIEGEYTISADIGHQEAWTFSEPGLLLMADTNNDGLYQYSERILDGRTAISNPTPVEGSWETWTISYTINSSTQTANGDLVLGHEIGFYVLDLLDSDGYAFDNLNISVIPEPSTTAALLGVTALIGACGMRRRR